MSLLGLVVLVGVLVIWKYDEVVEAVLLWRNIEWYYFAIAVLLQLASYSATAFTYRALIRVQGFDYPFQHLFRSVTVLNFFNRVMPSMGVSGGAFMISRLHQDGISRGRALIVAVLFQTNMYIAFFVLFILSSIYVFFNYDIAQLQGAAIIIAMVIVVGAYSVIFYIVSKKGRLVGVAKKIIRLVSQLSERGKGILSRKMKSIVHELDEIYDSWWQYWHDLRNKVVPLSSSLIQHIIDILTLYAVFAGLGSEVHFGVLVVAYVAATILAFVTFIPSGIGIFETSMVLVLTGLEVPLSLALSGVLAFRTLFYWLPVPIGFYFYKKTTDPSYKPKIRKLFKGRKKFK